MPSDTIELLPVLDPEAASPRPFAEPSRLGSHGRKAMLVAAGALAAVVCVSIAKPTSFPAQPSKSSISSSLLREYATNGTKKETNYSTKKETSITPAPSLASTDNIHQEAWPCEKGEQLFFGECLVHCNAASNGVYPNRTDKCTCCKEFPGIVGDCSADCQLYDVSADGTPAHKPWLPNCPHGNEELYKGLCYQKCGLLTMNRYPIRTGMNTCSNGRYGGTWTMGLGPCSGFGVGGTGCTPHIPQAAGMGFDVPATGIGHGEAPLGFTEMPMPNATANLLQAQVPGGTSAVQVATDVVTGKKSVAEAAAVAKNAVGQITAT